MNNFSSNLIKRRSAALALIFAAVSILPSHGQAPLRAHEVQVPFTVSLMLADTRNTVYIIDSTYNRVISINTITGDEVAEAAVDDGDTYGQMAVSVDGTKLYIPEFNESEILVYSLPSLTRIATLTFPLSAYDEDSPCGLASAVNGRLFVSTADEIDEVDPDDGTVLYQFPYQDSSPDCYLHTNPDGTHLYTVSGGGNYNFIYLYHLTGDLTSAPVQNLFEEAYVTDSLPDEKYGRYYSADEYYKGIAVIPIGTDSYNSTYTAVWPFTTVKGLSGVSFFPSGDVVYGAATDSFDQICEIRAFDRASGTPVGDWLTPITDPTTGLIIAASANDTLVYCREDTLQFTPTPTILGLISRTGTSIHLKPTLQLPFTLPTFTPDVAGDSQYLPSTNLPVSYKITGPAVLQNFDNDGPYLEFTGIGTVTITAEVSSNATGFAPFATQKQTIQVTIGPQTLYSFGPIYDQSYANRPFVVYPPNSTSGLPVKLTVQSGPATLRGDVVTLTGTGTVTLAADQPGNVNYTAAPEVTTSFVVYPASEGIAAFKTIPSKSFGTAPFAVTVPAATSKLPVTLSVLSGPATLSGDIVTVTGTGTVTLAANQAGNSDYTAAPQVTTTFTVNPDTQTIGRFATIAAKTTASAPFVINPPTATSHLPVTVTVLSGPATINGDTITLTGTSGTVVLAANQAGDADYSAAPQVTTSFIVK